MNCNRHASSPGRRIQGGAQKRGTYTVHVDRTVSQTISLDHSNHDI